MSGGSVITSKPLPEVAFLPSLTQAFLERCGAYESPVVASFAAGPNAAVEEEGCTLFVGALQSTGQTECRISSVDGNETVFPLGGGGVGSNSEWGSAVHATVAAFYDAASLPSGAAAFTATVHGPASPAALLLLMEELYDAPLAAEARARILGAGAGAEARRVDLAQFFPEQHGLEVLRHARALKAAGNALFKAGNVRGALQKYHRIHLFIGGLKKKSGRAFPPPTRTNRARLSPPPLATRTRAPVLAGDAGPRPSCMARAAAPPAAGAQLSGRGAGRRQRLGGARRDDACEQRRAGADKRARAPPASPRAPGRAQLTVRGGGVAESFGRAAGGGVAATLALPTPLPTRRPTSFTVWFVRRSRSCSGRCT